MSVHCALRIASDRSTREFLGYGSLVFFVAISYITSRAAGNALVMSGSYLCWAWVLGSMIPLMLGRNVLGRRLEGQSRSWIPPMNQSPRGLFLAAVKELSPRVSPILPRFSCHVRLLTTVSLPIDSGCSWVITGVYARTLLDRDHRPRYHGLTLWVEGWKTSGRFAPGRKYMQTSRASTDCTLAGRRARHPKL